MADSDANDDLPLPAPRPTGISDETLNRFIDVSFGEIENKRQEFALRQQELAQNSAHAMEILAAQERDLEAQRQHERRKGRDKYVFWSILLVAILGLFIAAMVMNKDNFMLDLIKVLAGAAAGWGGAKMQGTKKTEE